MSESLPLKKLTDHVSVTGQLTPDDMQRVAEAGFKSVINNRPDFEGGADQPRSADIEKAALAAGLKYYYQPVNGANIQADDIDTFGSLLQTLPGPVLAFCRTGTRSGNLFHAATAQK